MNIRRYLVSIVENVSSSSQLMLIYSTVWVVYWTKCQIQHYDWSDRLSVKLLAKGQLMDWRGVDYLWIIVMILLAV